MRTMEILAIVLLGACSRDACDLAVADAALRIPDCNPNAWEQPLAHNRHDEWWHTGDWFWTYDVCMNDEMMRLMSECRTQDTDTAADTGLNP